MRSKELKWSFSGVLKPEYCNLKHSFKLTFRIKTPIKSSLFSYKIYKYRSWINNINILQEQSILPVSYWSCSILSGKSCWQPALTVLLQETELCLHSKSTVEMVKPRGFLYAVQVISLKHLMSQLGDGETFFFCKLLFLFQHSKLLYYSELHLPTEECHRTTTASGDNS